jgi:hypothetical protein
MRYAFDQGCDLAMMVAEAGSDSQRNAEREGFRIGYTRMKWRYRAKRSSSSAEWRQEHAGSQAVVWYSPNRCGGTSAAGVEA